MYLGQLIVEQVLLPCECVLMWNTDETRAVLCELHSREYMSWDGNDEEFIKILTTGQGHQMRRMNKSEREKLR